MLNDSYVEQSVQTKPAADYYLKLLFSIILALVGFVSILFIGSLGLVIFAIAVAMFFTFLPERKLEYEYIITNGNVDIAGIYNASKRKNLLSFDLEQITMIVPKDSERIATESFAKKRDYSSRSKDAKIISMVVEIKNRRELINLEPNEKTMAHIKSYARNKIYDL